MTPKQREQAAREASNEYLISVIEKLASADKGSVMFIPKLAQDSFLVGYHAGRAAGMAEAAEIVLNDYDVMYEGGRGHYEVDVQATVEKIAQAIRAASGGT